MALSPVAADFTLLIVTATVLGFFARKTRQPTLVAYILSGILLGPILLDLVTKTDLINLLSELGLAFLLFLIGIEMDFDEIKDLLKPILRIALLQRILQTALVFGVAYILGFSTMTAVILSIAVVLGSTAEVVKLLTDRDEISTLPSKIDVGVLLFQDIVIVFAMALISSPDLGSIETVAFNVLKILGIMAVIGGFSYITSQYVLPKHFRKIAGDDQTFFIHGVAWLFLFVAASQYLNISVEIGAFLAGLGLGQMPYSSELRERMRPLTDFFMAVFFSSIALSMTGETLLFYWKEALISSAVFMTGNFVILFYLIDREKFTPETSFKGGINMTQVSEFSLVIGSLAVANGFIQQEVLGYLSLMAVVTMGLSAYLINYSEQLYQFSLPVLSYFDSEAKSDTSIKQLQDHAVVVGYNDLVERALPVLGEYFDDVIVVDRNPANVEELTRSDYEYIFGDFKHGELRKSVNLSRASLILSVSDEFEVNTKILDDRNARTITFLRAITTDEAAELYDMGADYIIRKNMLAAEKVEEYLETYFDDRSAFIRQTQGDRNRIEWGARGGR